jgi:hypothetical protein
MICFDIIRCKNSGMWNKILISVTLFLIAKTLFDICFNVFLAQC